MTSTALKVKRDEVLANCDVIRIQHGERSMQFAEAEKTLALLDQEIAEAEAEESGEVTIRQLRFFSSKGL